METAVNIIELWSLAASRLTNERKDDGTQRTGKKSVLERRIKRTAPEIICLSYPTLNARCFPAWPPQTISTCNTEITT